MYYYFYDEFGTFIVGGIDTIPSFRGIISQVDLYRRIAFNYDQVYFLLRDFHFKYN